MEDDEMSFEDLALMANDKVDALIDLLIEKKIITEKEFDDKMEEVLSDIDDDDYDLDEEEEKDDE